MQSSYWKAVALLIGTQIGAGVLGLPYAIKGLGFFWGAAAIILASLLMLLTALFILESLYVTNPRFHLFDLVEHYFGRAGALVFLVVIVLSVYGALSAYLSGMSDAIHHLTSLDPLPVGVALWVVLSFVVAKGIRTSVSAEAAAVVLMGLLFFSVILLALARGLTPYHESLSLGKFFTAFSVAVFAFFAHLVLPEVIRLVRNKKDAIHAVTTGFTFTTLLYITFSLAVIGLLGKNTPEISVFGLVNVFGPFFAPLAYLIPILTMLTSFIGVALGTVDMVREFTRNKLLALSVVLIPPLFFFLTGAGFFLSILFGSIGLLLAGGIIPSLLILKLKRERLIPHRVWVAGLSLLVFVLVLIIEVKRLLLT